MPGEPLLAFDDFVVPGEYQYSSSFLNDVLAELESYSIQLDVDSFGEGEISAQLETSADGRNWIEKNPGLPEVFGSFPAGISATYTGTDVGARPALALVRLRLFYTSNDAPSSRVRIYVRQGRDAGFTPLVLTPKLWLRADMGLMLDSNGKVSRWRDMTLNGFDAVQPTSTRRPAPGTSMQRVGDRPAVVFDASTAGTEKIMSIAQSLAAFAAGHTFVVFRRAVQPPTSALRAGFLRLGTSGLATHVPYTDGVVYDDTGSTTRRTGAAAPTMTASAYCHEVTTKPGAWLSALNGQVIASAGSNTVGFSATPELGGDSNVAAYFDGYVAEVVLFDRVLTPTERERVVQYVKARYLIASFP